METLTEVVVTELNNARAAFITFKIRLLSNISLLMASLSNNLSQKIQDV